MHVPLAIAILLVTVTISRAFMLPVIVADAPVITFGRFNPLIVVESSSVTLRCMVDANPPVDASSIRWLRSGFEQGRYHTVRYIFSVVGHYVTHYWFDVYASTK